MGVKNGRVSRICLFLVVLTAQVGIFYLIFYISEFGSERARLAVITDFPAYFVNSFETTPTELRHSHS